MAEIAKSRLYAALAVIVLATIVAYLPVFDAQKELTNWDDNVYVTNQTLVTSLSADTVAKIFDTSTQVSLNYHPLTMLSLAINHKFSGMSARGYAVTNLVLHILNTLLVFAFIWTLSHRKFWVAALSSLWFGIHPMHVESVAWVSERKDVLYCFFLVLSLISYLQWVRKKQVVFLGLTFVAFVASLLSKAMATPLPFVYLLIDYYEGRSFSAASVLEKLPFLGLAVWFGLLALGFQSQEAIAEFGVLTTYQRFVFAAHGFYMYWVKMLLPFNLSAFYPYPSLEGNGNLPFLYYLAPFVAVAVVAVPLYLLRKNEQWFKIVAFSVGFYLLMIALVLQFISVGQVMMAERYSYVPYIGSLFLLTSVLHYFMERGKRALILGAAGVFSLALIVLAYRQAGTWKNSETLWTRVIDLYPYEYTQSGNAITVTKVGAQVAYGSRAFYWVDIGKNDEAYRDLSMLASLKVSDHKIYDRLGVLCGQRGELQKSLEYLNMAITLSPQPRSGPFYNRAITHANMRRPADAVRDFTRALELGLPPEDERASRIGLMSEAMNMADYEATLSYAKSVVTAYPDIADGYFYAGTALVNLNRASEAVEQLTKAVQIMPTMANAWYNLSVAYMRNGNSPKALAAALEAKKLGFAVSDGYLSKLR
jgi:tetratricopeptide (TPR) repeat protein